MDRLNLYIVTEIVENGHDTLEVSTYSSDQTISDLNNNELFHDHLYLEGHPFDVNFPISNFPNNDLPGATGFFSDNIFKNLPYASINDLLLHRKESFSEMLFRLIDEKNLKDSVVYKNANLDRRLFSKIRSNNNYVPSKKTAIAFCLALHLDIETAEKLLDTAGYSLSKSSKFDLIIRYLINHCIYDITFANIILYDFGEETLSQKERKKKTK